MKPKQIMTVAEYRALTNRKARVRKDEFDSEHERIWHEHGRIVFLAEHGEEYMIREMRHHPVALRIPGGRYTPDFMVVTLQLDGRYDYWFIEIKPADRISKSGKMVRPGKNRRDARAKLRAAAEVYPFWKFVEARLASTKAPLNWELELI